MAAAFPFDTLDYARKLEAAGVSAAQAEVHARALNDALATSVATRADIANLRNHVDERFASLETRIDSRFAAVDARFESLETRIDSRFAAVDARFASLETRIDSRFAAVDARFQHGDMQSTHMESSLIARISAVGLKLSGKIGTLQWMLGVLVAMNAAVLVQLLLK